MTVTMPSAAGSGYAGREVWGAFIDGAFTDTADAATFPVMEPATGRQLARVVSGDPDLVDRAVAAARRAFGPWRDTPPRERGRLLRQVAAKIRAHVDELAELEAREVGKPRRDALRFDRPTVTRAMTTTPGSLRRSTARSWTRARSRPGSIYEPYGVVAAILPFNWPPIHFSKKCAPALAAGNTVIVKPGEQAPLTVLRLVEMANEVLPPGVINAVRGLAAGPALAAHPQGGAHHVHRRHGHRPESDAERRREPDVRHLELGGKNAVMVLATPTWTRRSTSRSRACSTTRVKRAPRPRGCWSIDRSMTSSGPVRRATQQLVVGDRLDPATDIGPMVDAAQRDKVLAYLRTGLDEGARLVAQGVATGR